MVQTNWVQTDPRFALNYSITVTSGEALTGQNFGDHASPALSPLAVIDNSDSGFTKTGTWTSLNGGYKLDNLRARTVSGPTATATWTFTGLSKGSYDV